MKGAGIGALLFVVDGQKVWLSAAEARERQAELQALSDDEAAALECLGEALLPGSAEAGIAHFVDHQLAGDPADALLLIRHLDWPGPLKDFYQQGLRALEQAAAGLHGKAFAKLDDDARKQLIDAIWTGEVDGWEGPPSPLFYLAARSDAVDVVYGTVAGFEKLDFPYMPHIAPQEVW